MSKDILVEVLAFLIKYADDIDVGHLLKNCKAPINNRKPLQNIDSTDLISNKELLLLKLCLASHKFYVHHEFATSDDIVLDSFRTEEIKKHLKIIAECYNSYFTSESKKENVIISKDTLGITIDNTIKSIENFKENQFPKEIIKTILHCIINSYTEHKFYYKLNGKSIVKFEINKNKFIETEYKLLLAKRTTYIVNEKTGLKINLGVPKQFIGFQADETSRVQNKNLKYFVKLNYAIINALAKEPKECYWCYPNLKGTLSRNVCQKCNEILNDLEYLQKQKRDKKNIINVRKELRRFNYKNYANVMTLRKRRKQYLEYVVIDCKENIKISDMEVVSLLEQIKEVFGTI